MGDMDNLTFQTFLLDFSQFCNYNQQSLFMSEVTKRCKKSLMWTCCWGWWDCRLRCCQRFWCWGWWCWWNHVWYWWWVWYGFFWWIPCWFEFWKTCGFIARQNTWINSGTLLDLSEIYRCGNVGVRRSDGAPDKKYF